MDPIALLLESHNEGRSFPPLAKPELLLVTCMDPRIALRLPENFAFVLRTGGANPDPVEPYLVYALARSGVRTVALVGHTDCAMSRPDLEALRTLPPLETGRAGRRLERLEIRAGQALEACRQDPTPEALHTLRRALRRLRYAREYLGKGTKELKTLQEVLGAFQDLTVALAHLEAFEREAKPLPRYRQALQRRREKAWAEVQRALLDRALTSVP